MALPSASTVLVSRMSPGFEAQDRREGAVDVLDVGDFQVVSNRARLRRGIGLGMSGPCNGGQGCPKARALKFPHVVLLRSYSKNKFQGDLSIERLAGTDSGRAVGIADGVETLSEPAANVATGRREVQTIENIEQLDAKLCLQPLS